MTAPSEACPESREKASLRNDEAFLYMLSWARSHAETVEKVGIASRYFERLSKKATR